MNQEDCDRENLMPTGIACCENHIIKRDGFRCEQEDFCSFRDGAECLQFRTMEQVRIAWEKRK